MFLLTTARQIEKVSAVAQEKPEILPWFLGFLVAMILLNMLVSKLGKKASKSQKKESDFKEKS